MTRSGGRLDGRVYGMSRDLLEAEILFHKEMAHAYTIDIVKKHVRSSTVDRGSPVVECRSRNREREPGFEFPLLQFRSLGIFVFSTTPQLTQMYNWVQWWKYELIVLARNCSGARMPPRKVELVPEWQVLPGVRCKALWVGKRAEYCAK